MLLLLEHVGQLAGERCLTGTLKARHQDNGRLLLQLEFRSLTSHKLGELIMYNLNHELTGLHSRQHIHTQGFFLHRIGKGFSHLIVDISIEQCPAHVLKGLGDVDFCDLSFAF